MPAERRGGHPQLGCLYGWSPAAKAPTRAITYGNGTVVRLPTTKSNRSQGQSPVRVTPMDPTPTSKLLVGRSNAYLWAGVTKTARY
ncbi:hypothetical protein B296_00050502 [Ensete ventricosum]|uniref:Uncharacterized protein n=1 Tax=Ensete ventricosum TaxID=4639 RepID=A0A426X0C7_ENSVE|nr:hypothetical protein B296_00050502 [Ensete ventricosum]